MKKVMCLILTAVTAISMLGTSIAAQSYNPSGYCNIEFEVRKADSTKVVKDGVIGEGEYDRLDISLDLNEDSENPTALNLTYGRNSDMYEKAEAMLATMEYYFSWDDEHGFNFAVKCKPDVIQQTLSTSGPEDKPGDDFLCNTGLQLELNPVQDRGEKGLLYYAIAKSTEGDQAYLEGHYGQLGLTGAYDPVADEDYCINYTSDGFVIYEWSVPFEHYLPEEAAAGTQIFVNIEATGGTATEDTLFEDCYGVALGDLSFLVSQDKNSKQAVATLSDDLIETEPVIDPWDNPFTDVKEGWYYVDPIAWASSEGIVNGKTATEFAPDDNVTREQIAAILYRYAESKGMDVSAKGDISKFADGDDVSAYAEEAISWANGVGIITGKENNMLAPTGNATRAEVATMLMRFIALK